MGAGVNGDLGKCTFGGKRYPKCPWAHFPEIFTNEHRGKWALGENGHLDKRYPKCLNIPVPISSQMFANGRGANGHLRKTDIWGEGVPQVP